MTPLSRRQLLGAISACVAAPAGVLRAAAPPGLVGHVTGPDGFDAAAYRRLLGAANAFKEGDAIVGVAAADEAERSFARRLLSATRLADIDAHPPFEDPLHRALVADRDPAAADAVADWTCGDLKRFLLERDGEAIHAIMPGLSSDSIACVVRIMSDAELTAVGGKLFNPLPGSTIGGPGRLAARVQPNSPTDHVDDIRWQVFDAWSYGVGDLLLGTNPVSSDPDSVAAVEKCLADIIGNFGIGDVLPHCVLAHVDVQAEVESRRPGSTALWFQSLAGSDAANATFDVNLAKMLGHAAARTGRYGLYF